jgi:hypothetical protein
MQNIRSEADKTQPESSTELIRSSPRRAFAAPENAGYDVSTRMSKLGEHLRGWRCFGSPTWVLVVMAAFASSSALPLAHDPIGSTTWARDVEPIIRDRCTSCHSADGPALPRLVSYDDVRANGEMVKAAVMARRMPIWAPVRGEGRFANDPSLSPYQISVVASWVESGSPAGPPSARSVPARLHGSLPDPPGRVIEVDAGFSSTRNITEQKTISLPGAAGITGWRLESSDPAATQVRVMDAGGRLLWTWSRELTGENFPPGTAFVPRGSAITVETKRQLTDQNDGAQRPFRLRMWVVERPARPLDVVTIPCGSTAQVSGLIYALRPSSPRDKPTELMLQGAPVRRLALFAPLPYQDFRAYWLREPLGLSRRSTLRVGGSGCTLDLLVSAAERRLPTRS